MKGEFCRVLTKDGLELQGLFVCPEDRPGTTTVLHVHGLAGNFYENRFIDHVAEALAGRGQNFLTVNTRGRDYLSDFICETGDGKTEFRQIGGIHEIFRECTRDIEAWVEFLISRGTARVILQGHSHGALKVTYYLYKKTDPRIAGLILLSPSDDLGRQRARIGDRFDEALEVAQSLITRGDGANLMPQGYFHYPVSARTYVDIFGRDSLVKLFNVSRTDTDDFPELASLTIPVLAVVGSVDEEFLGGPQEYLDSIRVICKNAPGFEGHVVVGAPHTYLHFEPEVARRVTDWVCSLFG